MFKKFLSKIGIGAATVDLILDNNSSRVGEEVTGKIQIQGGNVDQQIGSIYVNLEIRVHSEEKIVQRRVESVLIAKNVTIGAGQHTQFPFRYTLPELPQSSKMVFYNFHTTLNIPGAINKHDSDTFYVLPRPSVALVQEALKSLGFQESHDSGEFNGFYQEFEYKVATGPFLGRIDELEVVLFPVQDGVHLHIELDKRGRGLGGFLAEAFDMDEQYAEIVFRHDTLTSRESVQKALTAFLEAELNNPQPNRIPTLPRLGRKAKGAHGQHQHGKFLDKTNPAYAAGLVSGFAGYALSIPLDASTGTSAGQSGNSSGGGYSDFGGGGGDFGGGGDAGGGTT